MFIDNINNNNKLKNYNIVKYHKNNQKNENVNKNNKENNNVNKNFNNITDNK